MCTYETRHLEASGSVKGSAVWSRFSDVTVYFDHPVHAPTGHSLNVDFLDLQGGGPRVGLELDPAVARSLALAILDALSGAELMGLIPGGSIRSPCVL